MTGRLSVPQHPAAEGLPCTPETTIWGYRSLVFLPLSFWGTRLPFWFSLSAALGSVTDTTVASQGPAYVCACMFSMSGSSGRQSGILFLNFGSCCTAPHIMAPSFCYQFSKKNKATKPMSPREQEQSSHLKIFILTKKPHKITKNIKPSVSSQLHAAVLLQAVEYFASPSNCSGFRDFSRFLFLEICWSSASFPQQTRSLCGSVQPFIMESWNRSEFLPTWKQNLQWISQASEPERSRTQTC